MCLIISVSKVFDLILLYFSFLLIFVLVNVPGYLFLSVLDFVLFCCELFKLLKKIICEIL